MPQHKGRHLGAIGGGAVGVDGEKARGAALPDDVLAHLELRQGPLLATYAETRAGGGNPQEDAGVISLAIDPVGDVDAVVAGDDVDDAGHLRRAHVGLAHELHRHEPHLIAV